MYLKPTIDTAFPAIIFFEMNLLVNMDILLRTAQKVVWQVNDSTFWYFLQEIAKSMKKLRKVFEHLPDASVGASN
jgi:hypothetical protein